MAIQLSPAIKPLGGYEAELRQERERDCTRREIEKMHVK